MKNKIFFWKVGNTVFCFQNWGKLDEDLGKCSRIFLYIMMLSFELESLPKIFSDSTSRKEFLLLKHQKISKNLRAIFTKKRSKYAKILRHMCYIFVTTKSGDLHLTNCCIFTTVSRIFLLFCKNKIWNGTPCKYSCFQVVSLTKYHFC